MKLSIAKISIITISLCLGLGIGIGLAISSPLATQASQGNTQASHRGLKLVQTTESSGIYDVWVAADAIRVYSRSNDYYIAAQAPTWQIQVWRPDRKQCGQIPFEKFIKSDLVTANQISYLAELTAPNRIEKVVRGQDKLLIYHFPPIETVNGSGLFIADRKDGNGIEGGQKLRPRLISFDNNFASQTSQLVGKIYNIPKLKGFPISSYALLPNNKTDALLNCIIASRDFEFKTAALHAPTNYKKIPLDKKMFFTTHQTNILDEMTAN
jgi:hypothetical protein